MKKNLTIATFISNNEMYNDDLIKTIKYLESDYEIELIALSDKLIDNFDKNVRQVISKNTTKYKRIKKLIEISTNSDILCLDNDITTNKRNLKEFIDYCFTIDYSIAWGKIKSIKVNSLTSHLVAIDKNLSHDYIRPLLWKCNVGISLPGQIFMMNKNYYDEKLSCTDTVYDDLTIGVITKQNKMPIYFTKEVLGYEVPKISLKALIAQRKRWAKGFAQTIYNNRETKMEKYVLLHGFVYHLLWLPVWIFFVFLFCINRLLFLIIFLLMCLILSRGKFFDILWSAMYIMIFPFIHSIWLLYFIFNLAKQYNE